MFKINDDKSIYLTRGDIATIDVSATGESGLQHIFQVGDIIRLKVFEKKDCECVVLQKDVEVIEETDIVSVRLNKVDTKLGELISKPKDYWYEIELNPETSPQTIVGYDDEGAKVFKLFPEGRDFIG